MTPDRSQASGPSISKNAESSTKPSRDSAIEGLRGFAALTVFLGHLFSANLAGWRLPEWLPEIFDGPAAVLVFFVLSGYVIGCAYTQTLQPVLVGQYALRRLVRLEPIYLIALLLGGTATNSLDAETGLAHLFFLQNYTDYFGHLFSPIEGNPNLWSLNYEVLYYAAFTLIWFAGIRLRWWALTALLVGLAGWPSVGMPRFLCQYAWGYLFWLSGLWLAWQTFPRINQNSNWLALALLGFVVWKTHVLRHLLLGFHVGRLYHGVTIMELDYLPLALLLVAAVANRSLPRQSVWNTYALLWPLMGLVLTYQPTDPNWTRDVIVWLIAIGVWKWKLSLQAFRWAAPIGLISYGLYATARPIQILVYNAAERWGGPSGALWLGAALLTSILSFGVAWYLERRLQPQITRAIFSTRSSRKYP